MKSFWQHSQYVLRNRRQNVCKQSKWLNDNRGLVHSHTLFISLFEPECRQNLQTFTSVVISVAVDNDVDVGDVLDVTLDDNNVEFDDIFFLQNSHNYNENTFFLLLYNVVQFIIIYVDNW